MTKTVFGPVRSRRLGLSLGVNNIPPKICSYSCVYCQVGRTVKLSVERRRFYDPVEIASEIRDAARKTSFDYVTFVPDGEPTLDSSLGLEARLAKKESGRPVAVITNSSLAWREDVRADLAEFDYVSLKMDAASEAVWRRVDRPHPSLSLELILGGVEELARKRSFKLVTETMLVDGLNTRREELERIAGKLREVSPDKAYLAVPIRPPAEPWVRPPREEKLVEAYTIFSRALGEERVELLNAPEPPADLEHGDPEDYLLRTVMVHPLRLSYAERILSRKYEDPGAKLQELISKELVAIVEYQREKFVVRKFIADTRG